MTSISVVIPTYNRAHFLADAVDAVLAQTRPVSEILIVDDGSTDGTRDVVSSLNAPVRYLRQSNKGKSAALNLALGHCSGDFIMICDDDDLLLPNAIEVLAHALEEGDSGFAFGCFNRFSIDSATGKRTVFDQGYWPDLNATSTLIALLEDFFIFQNASLVRKAVYDVVGPFRTDLVRSQDYEMIIRIAARFGGTYVPAPVFLQRVHAGERGSSRERFGADDQFKKWMEYDAVIFRELRDRLPLSAYIAPGLEERQFARRAGLIQRACVYARRKLWDYSFEDLRVATELTDWPLSGAERQICRRFLLSKYGCRELTSDDTIAERLRELSEQGELGRDIVDGIARSLLWRIMEAARNSDLRLAAGLGRALFIISGVNTAFTVWSAFQDKLARPRSAR